MEHRVFTYSGHRHSEQPRGFIMGEERHEVCRVLETWIEETAGMEGLHRQVWRVIDQDGAEYRLTYYRTSDFWEIEKA